MSLKDRISNILADATARAEEASAAAVNSAERHQQERQEQNIAAALYMLDDDSIAGMVKIATDVAPNARKFIFAVVGRELRLTRFTPDGRAQAYPGAGVLAFPQQASQIDFVDSASRSEAVQARIQSLRHERIAARFPSTDMARKPVTIEIELLEG